MKLQLDTIEKKIIIEEQIKISDMIEELNKLFSNEDWKQYTIEVKPVYISYPLYPTYPIYPANPWVQPNSPYYGTTNGKLLITNNCYDASGTQYNPNTPSTETIN